MEEIELVGDVVALSMCVMTILWLLKGRTGSHCRVRVPGVGGMMKTFRQEFRHLIGREDGPIRTVSDLQAHQVSPEPILNKEGLRAPVVSGSILEGHGPWTEGTDETALPPEDRYQEAKRLAAMGLGKEKILERVSLPKGEVELLLKVNQLRSRQAETTGADTPRVIQPT